MPNIGTNLWHASLTVMPLVHHVPPNGQEQEEAQEIMMPQTHPNKHSPPPPHAPIEQEEVTTLTRQTHRNNWKGTPTFPLPRAANLPPHNLRHNQATNVTTYLKMWAMQSMSPSRY